MTREYKKREYWAQYAKGTYLKAGVIHNKVKGNPDDIIWLDIHGKTADIAFNMRPDEALTIIWALTKILWKLDIKGIKKWKIW